MSLFSSSQAAALSPGSGAASSDQKDPGSSQREKRPAPQPPGRSQAQSQRETDGQNADVKTVSVSPQRSVQMIAPLTRSDVKNTQSVTPSGNSKWPVNEVKHSKGPAPSRPLSVEGGPSPGAKTAPSSGDRTPNKCKQEPSVGSLNPFDDEEDEDELEVQYETSTNAGSTQSPPADAKVKSAKKARAPPLPVQSVNQNAAGGQETVETAPDSAVRQPSDLRHAIQESQHATVQREGEKKEAPRPASRR